MPSHLPDAYQLKTRVMPLVVMFVPPIALVYTYVEWVLFDTNTLSWSSLVSLTVPVILILLASLIGGGWVRDKGNERQESIFGEEPLPSVRMLRHRDSMLSKEETRHYHNILKHHVTSTKWPTSNSERSDPARADEVYKIACTKLREVTRGVQIVNAENIAYGFCRNMLGIRNTALVLLMMVFSGLIVASCFEQSPKLTLFWYGATILGACMVAVWILWATQKRVEQQAERYARQLLASGTEHLTPPPKPGEQKHISTL